MTDTIDRTYTEWAGIIHQWAVDKGWWDDSDRDVDEIVFLFVTECVEVFEEWRDGHPSDQTRYVKGKPEGVPIEVADIVIRVLDCLAEWEIGNIEEQMADIKANNWRQRRYKAWVESGVPASTGAAMLDLSNQLATISRLSRTGYAPLEIRWFDFIAGTRTTVTAPGKLRPEGFGPTIAGALLMIELFCESRKIDLFAAVALKHAYNTTRPYRHGGKLA